MKKLIKKLKDLKNHAVERMVYWDDNGDVEMSAYFNGMSKAYKEIMEIIK